MQGHEVHIMCNSYGIMAKTMSAFSEICSKEPPQDCAGLQCVDLPPYAVRLQKENSMLMQASCPGSQRCNRAEKARDAQNHELYAPNIVR